MSLPYEAHQQTLKEICGLFSEAEQAIKEVEDTGGELVVPAVNQLRYTGNHLVRYISDPAGASALEELADAAKHCKRATYDAYEAAILNQLMEYRKFKDDYRTTNITAIVPDYPSIVLEIEKARAFARNNNQSKTRGESYSDGRKHLKTIVECITKLNACRDELNKQINRDRHTLLFQIIGGVGVIAAVVSAVLVYIGCN